MLRVLSVIRPQFHHTKQVNDTKDNTSSSENPQPSQARAVAVDTVQLPTQYIIARSTSKSTQLPHQTMANQKLIIALIATSAALSTLLYLTSSLSSNSSSAEDDILAKVFALHANTTEKGATRRNLAAGIPQLMGGFLALDDNAGPWAQENTLQLFSSTPLNPRQYAAGDDTEFLHLKNVTEQDAYGSTTFPPTEAPTGMVGFSGGFRPTEMPTMGGGGGNSRVPTRRPAVGETGEPTR